MRKASINLPLWLGLFLVGLFVLAAFFGPSLAPHDPMEQNYAIPLNGVFRGPPLPPFVHPDYPLGTDRRGRDLPSRMLWGIRPTLIMVGTAAAIRLLLGILLGLFIGWGGGSLARRMESVLSSALSIPQLIVALIGVTAVGIENGLLAFIVGLSLNGWAETARVVADQTRIIRKQVFIEAAQALGASNRRILFSHVLNQILPLSGMLAAFEISAVLLLTAEMGFLGFYIGGGIYVEITDFVTQNVTGLPELGQMLSTALLKITDPSVLLMTGSVLLLAILGFNLLGEGLRREMGPERLRGSWTEKLFGSQLSDWVETHLSRPILTWFDANYRLVAAAFVLLLAWLGFSWYSNLPRADLSAPNTIVIPGGHLWASERHDAQGTRRVNSDGIKNPAIAWAYPATSGFSGAPAVDSAGTIYLGLRNATLLALHPNGQMRWQTTTPEQPIGGPALGPEGDIYLPGDQGGLMAFSPDGQLRWYWDSEINRSATSGAIVGPDGVIYYTVIDRIYAISPTGSLLWKSSPVSNYLERPPTLSPNASLIFLERNIYQTETGAKLGITAPVDERAFPDQAVFSGADGSTYFRTGHDVRRWGLNDNKIAFEPPRSWMNAQSGLVPLFPSEQGAAPDSSLWMFYSSLYTSTRLVWIDSQGRTLNNTIVPQNGAQIIAFDRASNLYLCNFTACLVMPQSGSQPLWEIPLQTPEIPVGLSGNPLGGALAEKTLYIVTEKTLFVIQEQTP